MTDNYQNSIQDETLYAKVSQPNSDCFDIGTVILHANKSVSILPESYHKCDLGDGMGLFDLDQKKIAIKTELSLPSDVILFFYPNENDAALGTNEIKGQYKSNPKILFIRAENSEGCYGTGQFDLVVETTPKINPLENKMLCEGAAACALAAAIQLAEVGRHKKIACISSSCTICISDIIKG